MDNKDISDKLDYNIEGIRQDWTMHRRVDSKLVEDVQAASSMFKQRFPDYGKLEVRFDRHVDGHKVFADLHAMGKHFYASVVDKNPADAYDDAIEKVQKQAQTYKEKKYLR